MNERGEVPPPEGRRLDERYRIERVGVSEGADERAVIALWTREGAMSAQQARERAADVSFVAVEREEGVVGVTTAWLQDNPHLRVPVWNYRTFVAEAHRESDIAFLLLHRTRDRLRDRYVSGEDTRAVGMLMEVQNEVLKRARNQAIWKTTRFTFIGEDERGAHHRVFYFPGALAPLPSDVARHGTAGSGAAR